MNHIFVDFENVPNVDLTLIRDRPANVTLLIGEKQRRLELELVRQIHTYAAQVSLVEVGASGRNALDLVLAWHLGQAAERHPTEMFFVVSRDKDFDPLIKHLRSRGLEVARVDSFGSLPFLAAPEPERHPRSGRRRPRATPAFSTGEAPPPTNPPRPRRPHRSETEPTTSAAPQDARLTKLLDRLEHKTKARPARRKTLLTHINGFYGNRLTPTELDALVESLEQQGVLSLDADGRVTYPHG